MTWAGGGASNKLAYESVKKALEARGQRLEPDVFICMGRPLGSHIVGILTRAT
jgi:hypothetical protein